MVKEDKIIACLSLFWVYLVEKNCMIDVIAHLRRTCWFEKDNNSFSLIGFI